MEVTNIEPGQKLWYVPQNGKPHEITVEKVGRQYAHFGRNYRINLANLMVSQGDFPVGRCHPDRELYESEVRRLEAWQKLKRGVFDRANCPDDITIDAIKQAARLLGVKI